jgi:hypothetical protein
MTAYTSFSLAQGLIPKERLSGPLIAPPLRAPGAGRVTYVPRLKPHMLREIGKASDRFPGIDMQEWFMLPTLRVWYRQVPFRCMCML